MFWSRDQVVRNAATNPDSEAGLFLRDALAQGWSDALTVIGRPAGSSDVYISSSPGNERGRASASSSAACVGEHTRFPVARLRFTKATGLWSIYWRDRPGWLRAG